MHIEPVKPCKSINVILKWVKENDQKIRKSKRNVPKFKLRLILLHTSVRTKKKPELQEPVSPIDLRLNRYPEKIKTLHYKHMLPFFNRNIMSSPTTESFKVHFHCPTLFRLFCSTLALLLPKDVAWFATNTVY